MAHLFLFVLQSEKEENFVYDCRTIYVNNIHSLKGFLYCVFIFHFRKVSKNNIFLQRHFMF